MTKLEMFKALVKEDERKKKQKNNKFNVCKEKAGHFDSFFEQQVFDNLTRMQKYYNFEFKFHDVKESVHWWTFNKWNKRYEAIGISKDEIVTHKIHHLYEPDFIITFPDGKKFYIESKGYFQASDRSKMAEIKKLYPDLDIRMLFQKCQKLKGLKNGKTNVEWATEKGFITHAGAMLPKEWFKI